MDRFSYKTKHNNLIENLKYYYEQNSSPIPKIIHFIWIGGPLGDAKWTILRFGRK